MQKTPKGLEIPVPTKRDVFKVLEKAAKPISPAAKPSTPRRRTVKK